MTLNGRLTNSAESLESNILRLKLIQAFKSAPKDQVLELIEENAQHIKLDPHDVLLSTDLHVLHIAVQAAPVDLIRAILHKFRGAPAFDINSVEPIKGDTPLHVAARCGRSDVVMYLLSLEDINDTVSNFAGKQPVEVARTSELAEAMQVVRAQYVEKVAILMKQQFANNDIAALEELLSVPRAATLLDINGQDPDTGSTVLHDFVRERNIPMIEFILSHGGDPFRRNSKGVLPIDATKDETVRRLLKQATKAQTVVIQTPGSAQISLGGPTVSTKIPAGDPATYYPNTDDELPHLSGPAPSMKGFLKKWTNFTGGYKLRWFVLENGVLSYYKKQGDIESACRGSINMKQARLHLDSTEKLQFEVLSRDSAKFHLKSNHPVETSRWVWALTNAIQYAKDQEKYKSAQSQKATPNRLPASGSRPYNLPSNSATVDSLNPNGNSLHLHRQLTTRSASTHASNSARTGKDEEIPVNSANVAKLVSLNNNENSRENYQSEYEEDDDDESIKEAPHADEISSCSDSIRIGLTSVESTIKSLRASCEKDELSQQDLQKGLVALDQAMGMINTLMQQFTGQVTEREAYFTRKIERDAELQGLWSTTIRDMELEKEKIEENLYRARQQRKQASKALREATGSPIATTRRESGVHPTAAAIPGVVVSDVAEKLSGLELDSDESSEDDEFFDAFGVENDQEDEDKLGEGAKEEGNAPDTGVGMSVKQRDIEELDEHENKLLHEDPESLTDAQRQILQTMLKDNSFAGYEDGPRKKLTLDDDNRPKISLWGVLKNLIGKDMTKMTLPVSFNECTNLLQRSAEDMEYTDLLDKAAACLDDPAERMVYVAAYAASSYSSTTNRIAKPFNPLLGETYEYCRPDKGYRMFSEQVSHHPPVGALIAQSPRWEFYGDSNVKSKFYGRSFDINPTGLWYLTVRPNKGADVEEELYTFRKVTSSVIGIITGSPAVDNYGDMEITNHTLGYKCILKFKARGWRGTNAYELKGTVVNSAGVPQWLVGGHWNDKIYAKKLTHNAPVPISNGAPESGDGSLGEGSLGDNLGSPSLSGSSMHSNTNNHILIWKVHDRPPAPFNLTPFAVTLNALPERLKEWIAPTDTRFRPDQRAMEEGLYDEAATEKNRVEVKQRAARREREKSGEPYNPRYFERKVHPVSRQEYWNYIGNYWPLRSEKALADKGDIF